MANPDRARKLLVRTAIVTTSTIATLFGAQNLAMLDARDFQISPTPAELILLPVPTDSGITSATMQGIAPGVTLQQSAPNITILRQSGQIQPSSLVVNAQAPIMPPQPAQISAPQPVIVQQPVAQTSRSTR